MRHIHPFPARMAPEIALSALETLSPGKSILDPMSGSGMVLNQASRKGLVSIGFDLDPLARLISSSGATRVNEVLARSALVKLLDVCASSISRKVFLRLPWIDDDRETAEFVDFWFYSTQQIQLRTLSYYLIVEPVVKSQKILNILKVSLSRLIITKEPKASLARDTAHSRPHRTILTNNFDLFSSLPSSLEHVLKSLDSESIQINAKTYLGDARRMSRVPDNSVDAIITSPPYLNAIDYMRGHRLSLVWLGYRLDRLRRIRGVSIGAEKVASRRIQKNFEEMIPDLELSSLDDRSMRMLNRYFQDLVLQCQESYRVLKEGAFALYVIGNSTIRGVYIQNSELLKQAGTLAGFKISNESVREIPDNRRYLPISVTASNTLSSRMKSEHIIQFSKASNGP